MYAIVEMQGQQFKAEAGMKLFIHRMEEAEVELSALMPGEECGK